MHECKQTNEIDEPLPTLKVTCGSCGSQWCERCDPGPSALCPVCTGRGYSTASLNPIRVDVYNKAQIEALVPSRNTALISINTPPRLQWDDGIAEVLPGWEDILRLSFHDFTNEGNEDIDNGWVVFTTSMANEIHAFIAKNEGKNFAVHCTAGQSRSVGVGVFLRDAHDAVMHLHAVDNEAGSNSLVTRKLFRSQWALQFEAI